MNSWYHLASINCKIDPCVVLYREYPWKSDTLCWLPDSQATFGASAPGKICSLLDLPSLAEYALTLPAQRRLYSFASYSLIGAQRDVKRKIAGSCPQSGVMS